MYHRPQSPVTYEVRGCPIITYYDIVITRLKHDIRQHCTIQYNNIKHSQRIPNIAFWHGWSYHVLNSQKASKVIWYRACGTRPKESSFNVLAFWHWQICLGKGSKKEKGKKYGILPYPVGGGGVGSAKVVKMPYCFFGVLKRVKMA